MKRDLLRGRICRIRGRANGFEVASISGASPSVGEVNFFVGTNDVVLRVLEMVEDADDFAGGSLVLVFNSKFEGAILSAR